MADDKSLFSLPIDDLGAFKKGADDISKTFGGIGDTWKKTSKLMGDAKTLLKGLGQSAEAPANATRKLNDELNKHVAFVKTAVGHWGKVTEQINAATEAAKRLNIETGRRPSVGGGDPGSGRGNAPEPERRQRRGGGEEEKVDKALGLMAASMKASTDSLHQISGVLLKSTMALGGAGTEAIGGMAEGLRGLTKMNFPAMIAAGIGAAVTGPMMAAFASAPDVAALRKARMGLGGLDIGELRAARSAGGWMPGSAVETLGNVVSAQRNVIGPQSQAFVQLFGARGAQTEMAKAPSEAMFDFLEQAAARLRATPKQFRDQTIAQYGMTNVASLAQLRAAEAMSPDELKQNRKDWEEVRKKTAMTPAEDKAWDDFHNKMKMAGELMEAGLVKNLTKLTVPLGAWLMDFSNFTQNDWFGKLTDQISENAKQIEAVVNFLKPIVAALGDLLNKITAAQKWVAEHGLKIAEHERDPKGHSASVPAALAEAAKAAEATTKAGSSASVPAAIAALIHGTPAASAAQPPGYLNSTSAIPAAIAPAPAKRSIWQRMNPFHRSAYGGDDYHRYIHQASALSKAEDAYGAYGAITSNAPGGALGAAGALYKYGPAVARYGGVALGAGVAAAPGLMEPRTAGGMGAAIANDNAERAKFWAFFHWFSGETKQQTDALKNINTKLDPNKPTALGQNVAFETGGAGGGFRLPGSGAVVGGAPAGGSGAYLASMFGGGGGAPMGIRRRTTLGMSGFYGGGGGGSGGGGGGSGYTGSGEGMTGHANRGINAYAVKTATGIRDHLMSKYGLTKEQATGFAGTLGYESGNFQSLQEGKPAIAGSKGGYGWAQWTGPRRREFESWAAKHNLPMNSKEANQGFLDYELDTKYKNALNQIKKTHTVADAAKATLVHYEGMPDTPQIRAMGGKPATRQHIQSALDYEKAMGGGSAGVGGDTGGANADFFTSRSGARVSGKASGLNAEFAGNLQRAVSDAEKATGEKGKFTSLVRDRATQERLYYNYIHHIGGQGLAARPGTSLHERGMATDMAPGPVRDYVRAHAGEYGMDLVPGDPEHVQMSRALRAQASDTRLADIKTKAAVAAAAPSPRPIGLTGHQTPGGQQSASSHPLGLHNWQQNQSTAFTLHNKTGSDVHMAASTMAV